MNASRLTNAIGDVIGKLITALTMGLFVTALAAGLLVAGLLGFVVVLYGVLRCNEALAGHRPYDLFALDALALAGLLLPRRARAPRGGNSTPGHVRQI
jgi:hypothetical protein